MKVKLLLTGKTTERYLREGIDQYVGRIGHYVPFELLEVAEGQVMKYIRPGDWVVLLDERGQSFSSVDWARNLEQKAAHLPKDLVFVIGGPYGFTKELYDRSDELLSLSKMTMSHQLVRLVFLEQLYRAMTILKGEHYHHE